MFLAYEQALLFGQAKRAARGRGKESSQRSHKFSFVLRPDEGKYYWLKNDVPAIKVD